MNLAEFGINKRSSGGRMVNSRKEELLEAEVARLREQLKQANMEKSEINSEYEKLSTICRSQRQQLHGLKRVLASTTPPNKTTSKSQQSPGTQQQSTSQQGLFKRNSSDADQNSWQAFPEDLKTPTSIMSENLKPVRTGNCLQNKSDVKVGSVAKISAQSFTAVPAARSQVTVPITNSNQFQHFGGSRNNERNLTSQPKGWAAF